MANRGKRTVPKLSLLPKKKAPKKAPAPKRKQHGGDDYDDYFNATAQFRIVDDSKAAAEEMTLMKSCATKQELFTFLSNEDKLGPDFVRKRSVRIRRYRAIYNADDSKTVCEIFKSAFGYNIDTQGPPAIPFRLRCRAPPYTFNDAHVYSNDILREYEPNKNSRSQYLQEFNDYFDALSKYVRCHIWEKDATPNFRWICDNGFKGAFIDQESVLFR